MDSVFFKPLTLQRWNESDVTYFSIVVHLDAFLFIGIRYYWGIVKAPPLSVLAHILCCGSSNSVFLIRYRCGVFLTLHGLCVLWLPFVTSVVSLYSKGMKELLWETYFYTDLYLECRKPVSTLMHSLPLSERLIWFKMHNIFGRLKKYCDIYWYRPRFAFCLFWFGVFSRSTNLNLFSRDCLLFSQDLNN